MDSEKLERLELAVGDLCRLNKALVSEVTALRALCRAMAIQPVFNREWLVMSATTLLDSATAEIPPELQSSDTLSQAQAFLDGLLTPPTD